MKFFGWLIFIFLLGPLSWGQAGGGSSETNRLAHGQGISAPSINSITLFSNGFTLVNPVGASYEAGYRSGISIDGADSTSFGIDAGLGDGQYGMALGAYSNSCDEGEACDAFIRGAVSAIWGGFGLGFGVQEDRYTIGMMLNPNALHRFGFVVEVAEPNGPNNNRLSFGLGYSYVISQFSFSLDLSKRNMENSAVSDTALMLTPGVAVRIENFSVSLSYDQFLNDDNRSFSNEVWVGIGFRPIEELQITFYGEYVDRWTLQLIYYF